MLVSAVFHNRLDEDDFLGSSATINYLSEMNGGRTSFMHTDAQLNYDSPYNTYTNRGLPPGPICMPGIEAISAALYPEPNCNYYYFCATGVDGGTAFATNLEDHEENIEKYRDNWIESDKAAEAQATATSSETTETSALVVVPED